MVWHRCLGGAAWVQVMDLEVMLRRIMRHWPGVLHGSEQLDAVVARG